MNASTRSNVLIMQSGGPTPVLNHSLFGVVDEVSRHDDFGEIYGASHGLEGLLEDSLFNLRGKSSSAWNRIVRTPGAALGSSRRGLRSGDVETILGNISRRNIRYWFIIGGNDSAKTGHDIQVGSQECGYELTVINVPKTIDNDLLMTDHCPGYGSAARFVALATMGAGKDAEAMGQASPINIIEVMGRDAGWLAASSSLGKRDERDAPHLVCVPEVPVEEDRFLDGIESAYRRYGFAVAVVSENTRGPGGRILGDPTKPSLIDDFGHVYYEGPARYLANLVSRQLKVRTRYERPGTIQRSFMTCVSRVDAQEAEIVGKAAVLYALDGHTDVMVTLVRNSGDKYSCSTGVAPLSQVSGQVKNMPEEYLDPSNHSVTPAFIDYARPLIGHSLPRLERLE